MPPPREHTLPKSICLDSLDSAMSLGGCGLYLHSSYGFGYNCV
ncbi:hypothetical protein [uncultured Helicobacter sp.]